MFMCVYQMLQSEITFVRETLHYKNSYSLISFHQERDILIKKKKHWGGGVGMGLLLINKNIDQQVV